MAVINGTEIYFGIIGKTNDGSSQPAVTAYELANIVEGGAVVVEAEQEEQEGE